jgi:hypothetical protein
MRSVDIRTVDPATLVDIRNTKIDIEKPFMEKALDYLEQINNAYCFRCEDVLVKIRHNPNGPPLNTCMEGFFRSFPKT